jgi:hypothetical protein
MTGGRDETSAFRDGRSESLNSELDDDHDDDHDHDDHVHVSVLGAPAET